MNLVKERINYVKEKLPQEATSSNIMRHFLKIIRELYESGSKVILNIFCMIISVNTFPEKRIRPISTSISNSQS